MGAEATWECGKVRPARFSGGVSPRVCCPAAARNAGGSKGAGKPPCQTATFNVASAGSRQVACREPAPADALEAGRRRHQAVGARLQVRVSGTGHIGSVEGRVRRNPVGRDGVQAAGSVLTRPEPPVGGWSNRRREDASATLWLA